MSSQKTKLRREIWKKTNGICAHCGKKVSSLNQTIDHFVPKILGGGGDKRNLVPLCKKCNKEKMGNMVDPAEYYKFASKEVIDDCLKYLYKFKHYEEEICNIGVSNESIE